METHNDSENKPESSPNVKNKPEASFNAQHFTGTRKENEVLLEIHRRLRKNYTGFKDLPAMVKEIECQVKGENSQEASHGQQISPSKILSIAQAVLWSLALLWTWSRTLSTCTTTTICATEAIARWPRRFWKSSKARIGWWIWIVRWFCGFSAWSEVRVTLSGDHSCLPWGTRLS